MLPEPCKTFRPLPFETMLSLIPADTDIFLLKRKEIFSETKFFHLEKLDHIGNHIFLKKDFTRKRNKEKEKRNNDSFTFLCLFILELNSCVMCCDVVT